MSAHSPNPSTKAAQCGEPSYVWRAGQERRLGMILRAAGERLGGRVLENGCGVGMYVRHLAPHAAQVIGLEYDFERAAEAGQHSANITNAAGEYLPFPAESFSLILGHEVLEPMCRMTAWRWKKWSACCSPVGASSSFVPDRGYPFETHGIYWRGKYHFGNIPLVNYLPRRFRDRLAPHVRIYTAGDLRRLFAGLPVRSVEHTILFGAYDNIIARRPRLGRLLRVLLQFLERTPLRCFGLSHFWVLEKLPRSSPG